jgi:hypothetical protein
MKSLSKLTQNEIRKIALLEVEAICTDAMGMCQTEDEKVFALLYEFAHVAIGDCSNPHLDWKKKLYRYAKHSIKQGMYGENDLCYESGRKQEALNE